MNKEKAETALVPRCGAADGSNSRAPTATATAGDCGTAPVGAYGRALGGLFGPKEDGVPQTLEKE